MDKVISKRRFVIAVLAIAFLALLFIAGGRNPFSVTPGLPEYPSVAQLVVEGVYDGYLVGSGIGSTDIENPTPRRMEVFVSSDTVLVRASSEDASRLTPIKLSDIKAGDMISVYTSPRPFEEVIREPIPRANTLPFEEAIENPHLRMVAQYIVIRK